jgi:hypothetical protein
LLLQDENTQLQDRCAAKDDELKILSRRNDRLRVKLDEIKSQNTSEDDQAKEHPIEAVGHSSAQETSQYMY